MRSSTPCGENDIEAQLRMDIGRGCLSAVVRYHPQLGSDFEETPSDCSLHAYYAGGIPGPGCRLSDWRGVSDALLTCSNQRAVASKMQRGSRDWLMRYETPARHMIARIKAVEREPHAFQFFVPVSL